MSNKISFAHAGEPGSVILYMNGEMAVWEMGVERVAFISEGDIFTVLSIRKYVHEPEMTFVYMMGITGAIVILRRDNMYLFELITA
jgi:hypothetical protein